MSKKTPEQPQTDSDSAAPKAKKTRPTKVAPIHLAGGVPNRKPNTFNEQVNDVDAATPFFAKEVAGVGADYAAMVDTLEVIDTTQAAKPEEEVAATDAAPLKANVPETLSVKEVAPDDAAADELSAALAEPGVTSADHAPVDATPPNVVADKREGANPVARTDAVQTEFESECERIRRRIVAHEIAYALGWYPIADAVADLKRRYTGRLQNLAAGIGDAIGRSERFVYLLLKIADHPAELRARVREVGMGDDQGRLVQLTSLAAEDRDRALEAFGEGGATAFDAAIQRTDKLAERAKRDPAFAALLDQFAHPDESLGGIAEAAPSTPVPEPLTKQYPELTGMTYGDVLRHVSSPDPDEDDAPPTKGGKSKLKQRFSEGFDVDVDEEREVGLRKAKFAFTVAKVCDADGNAVDGARVTVMVLDKTL